MLDDPPSLYKEVFRPQLHFTPAMNWMNDPNGLVYYDGSYHLFYQYNPSDKVWGNMNWGHATSKDLIHWQHHDIAIHSEPEGLGYIFSGCVVVDWNNSSGLQQGKLPPLIALFTHNSRYDKQVQSIAYSNDSGSNWQSYMHNPVIEDSNYTDFRDPKVFYYEPEGVWIMCLAAGDRILFYRSYTLLDWQYESEFVNPNPALKGVWECPDLILLNKSKIGVTDCDSHWVLIVSIDSYAPHTGGSATQYFVGNFDGKKFVSEQTETLWLDFGADNYAGVTWSDIPKQDGRTIMIGWMSNWAYALKQPTAPWKGAMTLPRELNLVTTSQGLRLSCLPVRELEKLAFKKRESLDELPDLCDIKFVLNKPENGEVVKLKMLNEQGESLVLCIDFSRFKVTLDRSKSAYKMPIAAFSNKLVAPVLFEASANMESVQVRIVKDTASVEVIINNGLTNMTANYFTKFPLNLLDFELPEIEQGGLVDELVAIERLEVIELNSIWNQS